MILILKAHSYQQVSIIVCIMHVRCISCANTFQWIVSTHRNFYLFKVPKKLIWFCTTMHCDALTSTLINFCAFHSLVWWGAWRTIVFLVSLCWPVLNTQIGEAQCFWCEQVPNLVTATIWLALAGNVRGAAMCGAIDQFFPGGWLSSQTTRATQDASCTAQ